MTNVNITSFRKDIYKLLDNTIKYNEPINVSTKNGNAIILSEEDYNSLIETLYIESVPGLKKEILERANDSEDEFVSEDEVEW
ncbi:MAG TPA: prevent-host-death protein [Clostridiales bacterium]|nr:prevent-host-death protein [Clostridiales bacterium]